MAAPAATPQPVTLKDFKGDVMPTWCPGCGDFAVLAGVTKALAANGKPPHEVAVVSGIGCSSNLPHFLHAYGVHSLHGRSMPVATGVKLANPDLTVVVTGGDGDGYGIGLGHFVHAMRRNLDVTYVVMNNEIYGLTTGQTSPTTLQGMKSKSTPFGNHEMPINPISLALSAGASFVARGFSGDAKRLGALIQQGIAHKGFSVIDVQSPCVTYNKLNTYDWFRERAWLFNEDEAVAHDVTDYAAAVQLAIKWPTLDPDGQVPFGVFFESERPTYEDEEIAYQRGNPVFGDFGITKDEFDGLLKGLL